MGKPLADRPDYNANPSFSLHKPTIGGASCPLCGLRLYNGLWHACHSPVVPVGPPFQVPTPSQPCEHCFCGDKDVSDKPHVECCMCGTRRLK